MFYGDKVNMRKICLVKIPFMFYSQISLMFLFQQSMSSKFSSWSEVEI